MSALINWLFSKTKLGKLVDGYKTELSFAIWLFTYLVEGLVIAATMLPGLAEYALLAQAALKQALEIVRQLSEYGILVGVGHKAIKERKN